mgnify:CR=1 FL=1
MLAVFPADLRKGEIVQVWTCATVVIREALATHGRRLPVPLKKCLAKRRRAQGVLSFVPALARERG